MLDIKPLVENVDEVQQPKQTQTPDIKPEETVEKKLDEESNTVLSGLDPWKEDPNYLEMADFLGLQSDDAMNPEMANKISFIRDFTQTESEPQARRKIKEWKRLFGVTFRGKELVNHLYKYLRLYESRTRLDKEISLLKI